LEEILMHIPRTLAALAATGLLAGATFAQTAPPPPASPTSPARDTPPAARPAPVPPVTAGHFYKISTLTGMPVALGEKSLGKVSEVVINDGGCVQYLVVQSGPDAFLAVPWGATAVDFGRKSIALHAPDVTPDAIRQATFTTATWPTFTDPAWSERTMTLWGVSSPRVGAGSRGVEAGTTVPGATPATGTGTPGAAGTRTPGTTPPGNPVPGTAPASTAPGNVTPGAGVPRSGTPGTSPGTGTRGTGGTGTGTPGTSPGTTPPAGTPGKGGTGGPGGPGGPGR
jgi:hypothetical protein